MVFHVLVSLRHSKPFLESCSRSQKAHRKELLGHYLADSLGPLPPPCVRMEAGQTSTHRARRIIGVDLFDCQMSEWGHGYVSKRGEALCGRTRETCWESAHLHGEKRFLRKLFTGSGCAEHARTFEIIFCRAPL